MTYLYLFIEFFKIGLFTFGGGYASIPLIQQAAHDNKWMTLKELIDFFAISESTPGSFAINISTFVGAKVGGVLGSIISIVAFVLPSFIIIIIIAKIYNKFKENTIVKGILFGLGATVVGLVASTVITMGSEILFPNGINQSVFTSSTFYISLGIAVLCFILLNIKKINPLYVILLSAVLGIVFGYSGLIVV